MAAGIRGGIPAGVLWKCFLRSNMINSSYTLHGLQSIPFLYSITPGLAAIYPDKASFYAGCGRYAERHNCHPFWAPFLTGAFLNLERDIATGRITPEFVAPIKDTALNSLSALGDSFFNGSLSVTLFLLCSILMALGHSWAAGTFLVFWLAAALILKLLLFYVGISRGFSALIWIRKLGLNNKGDYLKLLNSVLLASLLALIMSFPPGDGFGGLAFMSMLKQWLIPVASLCLTAYLISRFNVSRTLLLYILGILLVLLGAMGILPI